MELETVEIIVKVNGEQAESFFAPKDTEMKDLEEIALKIPAVIAKIEEEGGEEYINTTTITKNKLVSFWTMNY